MTKPRKMNTKYVIYTLLLSFLLTNCNNYSFDIKGDWNVDIDKTVKILKKNKILYKKNGIIEQSLQNKDFRKNVKKKLENELGQLKVLFTKNEMIFYSPFSCEPPKRSYNIVKQTNKTITIEVTKRKIKSQIDILSNSEILIHHVMGCEYVAFNRID